jgi:hypothetical protein
MTVEFPLPSSLSNLHGTSDREWMIQLLPVLIDLHLDHPDGWKAPLLAERAKNLGAAEPSAELHRSKVQRTLDLFERIGYLESIPDHQYVLNLARVQTECRVAAQRHQMEVTRSTQFADTLLNVAALGTSANRNRPGSGSKSLISMFKGLFEDARTKK